MAQDQSQHTPSAAQWSSKFGFLMAAVGSAVGLGSIWKFPYMTGESGGSAFVVVFIMCITLIGFPVLLMEWLIGRRGKQNPVGSFIKVADQNGLSHRWGILGVIATLAAFLILSFYSVIGGWSLKYTALSIMNHFHGMSSSQTDAVFNSFLDNPLQMAIFHTLFMAITAGIVASGVTNGIERASKWMMPLLALIMIFIVGYNLFNADFARGFHYLFDFDAAKISGKVMIAALGHAFFCLSLAMGIMISYGSYLGREVDLFSTARTVVIWDIVFSLMAGLAIFPIMFSNGLDPKGGPGLVFVTLPIAFGQMSLGVVVGTLFFVLLTFAALTSSISVLEPVIQFLQNHTAMSRKISTLVGAVATWAVGLLALLSFNLFKHVHLLPNMTIFDSLDYLTSKIMLPIVGLGTVIFMAWSVRQAGIQEELGLYGFKWTLWQLVTKCIAPLGIVIVFIAQLSGYGD